MSLKLRLIAASLLLSAPALAAEERGPAFPDPQLQERWKQAEELARKSLAELLRSFEALRESLPQYGMPYIGPNGDIIIPRTGPLAPPRAIPKPEPERT
jgi:hypothetical protein